MNSVKSIHLPKGNLIPDLAEGEIFQHEGAQCLISREIQQNLADEGVTLLKEWLAECPEVWTEINRTVRQKNLGKFEELWKLNHREQHLMPLKMLKDFYASFHRCIEAIIQAEGRLYGIFTMYSNFSKWILCKKFS